MHRQTWTRLPFRFGALELTRPQRQYPVSCHVWSEKDCECSWDYQGTHDELRVVGGGAAAGAGGDARAGLVGCHDGYDYEYGCEARSEQAI